MPQQITPAGFGSFITDWKMSPGLEHDGFIFMTGLTGEDMTGLLSDNPTDQFVAAFEKIGLVLREAGLGFEHLVEMTSFHIGLRDHLDEFKAVRNDYVVEPFPAWTAIEVAGFVRDGVIIEIRCVARRT